MTNHIGYVAVNVDHDGGVAIEHQPCDTLITPADNPLPVTEAIEAIHAHSLKCPRHGEKV